MPTPIAARYRRQGLFYRADLITQRIENSEPLAARLLQGPLPLTQWIAVGPLHPALPRRRRVSRGSQRAQHPADARSRCTSSTSIAATLRKRGWWADTTLVRLYRSLEKVTLLAAPESFTDEDWHSLLAGYRESAGLPQASIDLKLSVRFIYICIAYLISPLWIGALALRGFRDRSHWRGFSQRFGFGPKVPTSAASGCTRCRWAKCRRQCRSSKRCCKRFPTVPLVLTTVTPPGAHAPQALFGTRVDVRYVPIDLPGSVRRFFQRVQPRLAVILETEIWPNLYHRCGRLGVPLVLASARISPRSVNELSAAGRPVSRDALARHLHRRAERAKTRSVSCRSARIPRARTWSGNIKFDFGYPPDIEARGHELRRLLGVHRPVWVAGSTHAKEEDVLLAAHRADARALLQRAAGAGAAASAALRRSGRVAAGDRACRS